MMNFDKPMIDLVREIRRRAAPEDKPGIKLANPDLLHELLEIHHHCADTIIKTLIKELFFMAGDPWPKALMESEDPDIRYITKVYRGQTQLIPVSKSQADNSPAKPHKIYRGHVIA